MAKIQEVRTTQVLAPIRRPLRNASAFIPSFPLVLIDLVRDDGVVGRAYTQIYFPELLPALEGSIHSLVTLIKGLPASPRDGAVPTARSTVPGMPTRMDATASS